MVETFRIEDKRSDIIPVMFEVGKANKNAGYGIWKDKHDDLIFHLMGEGSSTFQASMSSKQKIRLKWIFFFLI